MLSKTFIEGLGVRATANRYTETQWQQVCAALINHIRRIQ